MVNHNLNFYLTLVLMFFSVFAQVKDLGSSTCLVKQSEDTSLRNSQNSIYSEKNIEILPVFQMILMMLFLLQNMSMNIIILI